ncbi:MAG TPA: hypothetical protein PKC29_14840 [Thermodesulfobacteriota bacterium]|nr:hypothetical protein [Thermodesulfobacteriota bacterium]
MGARYVLVLMALGAFTLAGVVAGTGRAGARGADCEALMTALGEAEKGVKEAWKAQSKALKEWEKYYEELHANTYAGTEEPLADTVAKCQAGGGDFCERALDDYNKIAPKEEAAKKALDGARANTHQAQAALEKARDAVTAGNCR